MKLVNTYDIDIVGNGEITTMGLSTCMCLCIITKHGIIMWHYGILNKTNGLNMKRVSTLLNTIKNEDVIHVYLIPGIDRNKDLSLKSNCRTMLYRPNTNPTESRDWFLSFMEKYPWFTNLQVLNNVEHFKEFVIFHKNGNEYGYKYGRDESLFDSLCIIDSEQMT